MDNDDVLKVDDVAQVRVAVIKVRRRVLLIAAATSVASALVVACLANLKLHNVAASAFVGVVFCFGVGVPVFVHWWRHYRSILAQIDAVAGRVASGETVYGSGVAFHSYR